MALLQQLPLLNTLYYKVFFLLMDTTAPKMECFVPVFTKAD
jgi:hypothetical protein